MNEMNMRIRELNVNEKDPVNEVRVHNSSSSLL